MVDKAVEASWRVNVHFGDRPIEEMLQRSSGFVLGIEVEQRTRDLVGFKPLCQGDDEAGLADSTLTAHGENDAFVSVFGFHRDPPWLTSFNGSLSSKWKCLGLDFCAIGFALSAAIREATSSEGSEIGFGSDSSGGSSYCTCFRCLARTLTKE